MTTLTEIRTMWSNDTMGAIIGSGGKNITQVKQKNNTTITITKEPARVMLSSGGAVAAEVAAKPWRTLNIDGEWCSIWNSLCDIIKGVGVMPPPSPAADPLGTTAPAATTFHFLMKIPIPVAGMLVGKGGANLKEWRQKWPTALFEVQADNNDPVFRYFYLKGSSVDLCESCISIADVLEQALVKLKENGEDPLAALNSMTGGAPGVGGGETSRENNKNRRSRSPGRGGKNRGGGRGGRSRSGGRGSRDRSRENRRSRDRGGRRSRGGRGGRSCSRKRSKDKGGSHKESASTKGNNRNQQPGGAAKGGAGGFSNGPLTSGSNNVNVGAGNNSNAGGMNYTTGGGNNGGYVGGSNGGQPTINPFTGNPAPNGTNNYNFGGIPNQFMAGGNRNQNANQNSNAFAQMGQQQHQQQQFFSSKPGTGGGAGQPLQHLQNNSSFGSNPAGPGPSSMHHRAVPFDHLSGANPNANANAKTNIAGGGSRDDADPDVKLRHAIADATAMDALTTLTLREDQIGRVIGKKGENINKVRDCTACTITTDTKGDRTDGVREVQICGPIAQVMTALHMVQTMLALETIHGHGGGGIGRRGN